MTLTRESARSVSNRCPPEVASQWGNIENDCDDVVLSLFIVRVGSLGKLYVSRMTETGSISWC